MKEVVILLDNVRSALNVGAIFRTSDAAGAKKLYLCGITPYPPHIKIKKTALGAENLVAFEHITNAKDVINKYKKNGFTIIAIEALESSEEFFDYEMPQKILFIFGHEITGVSNELIELADVTLKLPMLGQKESLNVATTVGIVLYNSMFSKNK